MWLLITGLVLFLGIHSISIVALSLRDKMAAKSELGWKLFYSLVSLVGIVLIVKGYADLRQTSTVLYATPLWMRHVAATLLLPVFVLFLVSYFPGRIKNVIKHPQLLAVMLWAVAHLLVNGTMADVILFGSFLIWAIADRISMINRVSRPVPGVPKSNLNDVIVIVAGLALYLMMAFWWHELLFGVRPFV